MTTAITLRGALVLGALALSGRAAHAQRAAELAAQRYDVDAQHSYVGFAATILGAVKVRGRFGDYSSAIIYDPAHPERSSVSTVIQARSINTDMDFRDNHLRSPDFLDVQAFPTIEFQSDHVTPQAGGLLVSGMLTMHGVSRRVTFPATIALQPMKVGNTENAAFTASLRVSRADYRIAGDNKFNPSYNPLTNMLSDSVEITLEIDAIRQSYADNTFARGALAGVGDTVYKVLQARGVGPALELYTSLKATQPKAYSFSPGQLDLLGHKVAERGALRDAIAVLRFNADLFADTPGVIESLGDVQAMADDRAAALATYRQALARFPASASAREMVRRLAQP